MIVRLEPRGEAKSTAELYLSGKGTVPLSGPLYLCSVLFQPLEPNIIFSFLQKLN